MFSRGLVEGKKNEIFAETPINQYISVKFVIIW